MARGIRRCLYVAAVAFAAPVYSLEDVSALVQSVPGAEKPSKAQVNKIRKEVRQVVDNGFKRATTKAKVPIPQVMLWDLTGKITNWAMTRYQKPRKQATQELLDSVIDHTASVLNSQFPTMTDNEIMNKLVDWNKIQEMADHYIDQAHEPPSVKKLFDSVVNIMKTQKSVDPDKFTDLFIQVARETQGAPVADLLTYYNQIAHGKEKLDEAKAMELTAPVVQSLGAPPAIVDFIKETSEGLRTHMNTTLHDEVLRAAKALSESATQLHMPSAFSELFTLLGEILKDGKPPDAELIGQLYDIFGRGSEQLELPSAATEMIQYLGKSVRSGKAADIDQIMKYVSKTCEQMGEPKIISEMIGSMKPVLNGTAEQMANQVEITAKLFEELGAPDAVPKFERQIEDLIRKGTPPDAAKLMKMSAAMLRGLKMPALASIVSDLLGPIVATGKPPNPMQLAMVAPNLMKVMPDLEKGEGIYNSMMSKLLGPVVIVYEKAMAKLTGQMPESALKGSLQRILKTVGPHNVGEDA